MEDSALHQEKSFEGDSPEAAGNMEGLRLGARPEALLPVSVVGGIVGMLIGTLPASVWVLLFGTSFSPMYVFLPLFIYLGIRVFRGCRDRRGFAVACILSVIGFFLTVLSCQAALDVLKFKMLFLNLPLVTVTMIGGGGSLSEPVFSSTYLFPVLFTALGVMLVYELMLRPQEPGTTTSGLQSTPDQTQ
jgi:hypothetical protein